MRKVVQTKWWCLLNPITVGENAAGWGFHPFATHQTIDHKPTFSSGLAWHLNRLNLHLPLPSDISVLHCSEAGNFSRMFTENHASTNMTKYDVLQFGTQLVVHNKVLVDRRSGSITNPTASNSRKQTQRFDVLHQWLFLFTVLFDSQTWCLSISFKNLLIVKTLCLECAMTWRCFALLPPTPDCCNCCKENNAGKQSTSNSFTLRGCSS